MTEPKKKNLIKLMQCSINYHCNSGRKKSYFLKKEKMPRQHMTHLTHETKEASKAYTKDLQLNFKKLLTQFHTQKKNYFN